VRHGAVSARVLEDACRYIRDGFSSRRHYATPPFSSHAAISPCFAAPMPPFRHDFLRYACAIMRYGYAFIDSRVV